MKNVLCPTGTRYRHSYRSFETKVNGCCRYAALAVDSADLINDVFKKLRTNDAADSKKGTFCEGIITW